jgi:hypothetical protein
MLMATAFLLHRWIKGPKAPPIFKSSLLVIIGRRSSVADVLPAAILYGTVVITLPKYDVATLDEFPHFR